jgi:hypothetical protein
VVVQDLVGVGPPALVAEVQQLVADDVVAGDVVAAVASVADREPGHSAPTATSIGAYLWQRHCPGTLVVSHTVQKVNRCVSVR